MRRILRAAPSHIITALVMALVLAACAAAISPERQNAAQSTPEQIDHKSPYIIQEPNGFNNVSMKCDPAGNLVYVTSNKDTVPSNISVVPDAKFCAR